MKEKNTFIEPLKHFVKKHGVDISKIGQIACGRRYSAVLLKNGHIGVCANLLKDVKMTIEDLRVPDLNKIEHRIILTAYFNAMLNYANHYEKNLDIFEAVDFRCYKAVVMVGLFKPILEKFNENEIKIHVFDMIKESSGLLPLKDEIEYIKRADAIILTATSVFNGTFMEIVDNTGENCDIFLLGPSAIMDRDMFQYKNIKKIFGAIFRLHDERVLDVIKEGYGTKKFLKFGRKVSFY